MIKKGVPMSKNIRLDKYLSEMTSDTRSNIKKLIKSGIVTVSGKVVKTAETKVSTEDEICIGDKRINYIKYYYYMMNKPSGVITSTEKGVTKTVMDIFLESGIECPRFDELSPVGRLDKDTEGLLLITNDGDLNHRLLSPKNHVDKVYFAGLSKEIKNSDIEAFKNGIDLGDFICKSAKLEPSSISTGPSAIITISEGKFHQVKRMFEAVGNKVLYLKRLSMGSLSLDNNLKSGKVRELTNEELKELLK